MVLTYFRDSFYLKQQRMFNWAKLPTQASCRSRQWSIKSKNRSRAQILVKDSFREKKQLFFTNIERFLHLDMHITQNIQAKFNLVYFMKCVNASFKRFLNITDNGSGLAQVWIPAFFSCPSDSENVHLNAWKYHLPLNYNVFGICNCIH